MAAAPTPGPRVPARTVLYVDDEAANLTAFKYCFDDQFAVLTAASGAEALAIMERDPVAVLLADQRMPGMTGAELCAATLQRFPEVVRMIVTAYTDITGATAAINAGQVSRYILKPWREEQMAGILRNGVEAHQLGVIVRDVQFRMLQSEQQATMSMLLGRVFHELAQPMSVALNGSQYLADCLGELGRPEAPLEPAVRTTIEDLDGAARDTLTAIEAVVARIERFRDGEGPATGPASADLNRAVQAALAIAGGALRRLARLDLQLGAIPPVAADATQLSQILLNLLSNAADAIPPGRPRDNLISVRTLTRGDRAVLEIEDTGAGIAPELLPRVFEPFVTTKSSEPSRGFGLAVVRDLARRLRGDVFVRTNVGKGTCFIVELPLRRG